MNPLDNAFLQLNVGSPHAGPAPETRAPDALPAALHRADAVTWPDLIEQLVRLAAGRFHGVGEVLLQSALRGNKRIALASCHAGEGRTTLALALGRWFAQRHRGRKLLLLDADLGSGDLTRQLGLSGGAGASELLLSGDAPRALEAPEGLSILGAGGSLEPDAAPECEAWHLLAGWLRPHFDVILVDTGAALREGFGRREAQCLAEAVLWVRDPQRTSLSELCDAQRQVALTSVGVIENLVPRHRASFPDAERRHRVDRAAALHLHVNRLRGNGVANNV